MEFYTIASGSSGNCALVREEDTVLLIDAGISARRVTQALSALTLSPADLTAILITHEHSDHISGLGTLLKKFPVPVLSSTGTIQAIAAQNRSLSPSLFGFSVGESLSFGPLQVQSFSSSHDAAEPVGYRIDSADGSLGFLTDTGLVTDAACDVLLGVDTLLLEANHDVATLQNGPYPYSLKQRIAGPLGHLSNQDAADFAVKMAQHGTNTILLAHLSEENNQPAFAMQCVQQQLGACRCSASLYVAPRSELSQEFHLCRKSLFYALEN